MPYISGQFMFDTLSMASILNNQDTAQALADGLMELSREGSVSVVEEKKKTGQISAQINPSFHLLPFTSLSLWDRVPQRNDISL